MKSLLSVTVLVSVLATVSVIADPVPLFYATSQKARSVPVAQVIATNSPVDCEGCVSTVVGPQKVSYPAQKQWGPGEKIVCWGDVPGGANDFARSRAETLTRQFSGEFGCVPVMPCEQALRGNYGCQTSVFREPSYSHPQPQPYLSYSRGNQYSRGGGRWLNAFASASFSVNSYPSGYGYGHRPGVFYGRDWGSGQPYVVPVGTHFESRSLFGNKFRGPVRSYPYGSRNGHRH